MQRRQASLGRLVHPVGGADNDPLDRLRSEPDNSRFSDATCASTSSTVATANTVATRCHTADLAITDDGGLGAPGEFFGLMVVRNITKQTCTVYGYPGLQSVAGSGQRCDRQAAPSSAAVGPSGL